MSSSRLIDTLYEAKVITGGQNQDLNGVKCNVCGWTSSHNSVDEIEDAICHWHKCHAVHKVMHFIEVDAIDGIPELVYFKNEYDLDTYVYPIDSVAVWSGEGWYNEIQEAGHCRCGKCLSYIYVRVTKESHGELNQRQLEILGW